MKSLRIAFFVNDIEREFAGYTTTVLAYEATLRGHRVCYVTPSDFVLNPDDTLSVHGRFVPKKKYKDRPDFFDTLRSPATKLQVVDMAEKLGLRWDPQQEAQGVAVPSLTLGTIGVHQIDLAGAYGALANGGVLAPTYLIERIIDRDGTVIYDHAQDGPKPKRVLSPQSAYLVTDILADNTDPAQNSIWGERFQLQTPQGRRPATLKTGTTNESKDTWFSGFTADFVASAWVGFDDNTPLGSSETGGRAALPMWLDFMKVAHEGLPARDFEVPPGVVEVRIDPATVRREGAVLDRARWDEVMAAWAPLSELRRA